MSDSDVVIRVEGLGKKYSLHHEQSERYTALRDVVARQARAAGRRLNPFTLAGQLRKAQRQAAAERTESEEEFWALKDVSFEIRRGERVGIIGRNGAGKSTLLKILSRITEPTTGRVEIRGRVASLLEVGTGFHPELTGRENIYLNGAILGMTRREIRSKFDEIVDFAEVEKFLDTPVKRYSSGMYVRLAFAVAAHLEPEILVVDEVLAVGDASFQKKCLGKMGDVSKDGRTILFVSHNMAAVQSLCIRCILIADGKLRNDATSADAISLYMQGSAKISSSINLVEHPNRAKNTKCWLTKLELSTIGEVALHGQPLDLIFSYDFSEPVVRPQFCAAITTMMGSTVFTLISDYQENNISSRLVGKGRVSCRILKLPLMPGDYLISVKLWVPGQKLDEIENVSQLKVEWHEHTAQQVKWNSGHGSIYVDARWRS